MVLNLTRYDGNRVSCDKQIANAGQRMATAREGMLDRIADIKANKRSSDYFSKGGWGPEGTSRIGGVVYWCQPEFAPTTHYAQETLTANLANKYLTLTEAIKLGEKSASEVIQMIAKRDVEKLPEKRGVLVPDVQETGVYERGQSGGFSGLAETDVLRFLARGKKLPKDYIKMLRDSTDIQAVRIYQIPINVQHGEDIASGFWLCRLDVGDYSGFSGNDRDFNNDDDSAFGVRSRVSAEGTNVARNFSAPTLK